MLFRQGVCELDTAICRFTPNYSDCIERQLPLHYAPSELGFNSCFILMTNAEERTNS
jgi:hypothetical protein